MNCYILYVEHFGNIHELLKIHISFEANILHLGIGHHEQVLNEAIIGISIAIFFVIAKIKENIYAHLTIQTA